MIMRTEIDEPQIPSGLAIFGTDDGKGELSKDGTTWEGDLELTDRRVQ